MPHSPLYPCFASESDLRSPCNCFVNKTCPGIFFLLCWMQKSIKFQYVDDFFPHFNHLNFNRTECIAKLWSSKKSFFFPSSSSSSSFQSVMIRIMLKCIWAPHSFLRSFYQFKWNAWGKVVFISALLLIPFLSS